ncbi:MAG: hypothetical protein HY869_03910 [Chloroflexi bacterium]|nr:hypothetical protein [Chloroflexota bacterium]
MPVSASLDCLSRLALEWTPIHPLKRTDVKLDVFKHSLSATDGLPPYAQARIIDLISNQLLKARPRPCLWVSVDAPGAWYFNEILRLVKRRIPMAIVSAEQTQMDELVFHPYASPSYIEGSMAPAMRPRFTLEENGIKAGALRVLRILARLKTAHTPEIRSLAGVSETYVRTLLKQLQGEKFIEWKQIGKYQGWGILNKGLRLAHRSWNLPKGVHFTQYRGEFRYAGERHRRVARMWRAWLEAAYPEIEIWECWTEVPLQKGIPDALAWGRYRGCEALFWLEVDSGHSSRQIMQRNYRDRVWNAYLHAKEWGIPIVFCIMGPPWVVDEFPFCISQTFSNLALIGHDWRDFGSLPVYGIGEWHQDLDHSRYWRRVNSCEQLPFDPKQYPPKPREDKKSRASKPKSTKPRFSKGREDADRWYRKRSEGEE